MRLNVYFDGSCGPKNPGGTAAYGFVVKTESGDVLHSGAGRACRGKDATSNVGEYEGLYQAMVYVQKHYPTAEEVTFFGDSALVIAQMKGEVKARKGKYLPYYQKSIEFAAPHRDRWKFRWIARGFNREADELSQYHRD